MTNKNKLKSDNGLFETDEELIEEAMKEKLKLRQTGRKDLNSLEELKKNL